MLPASFKKKATGVEAIPGQAVHTSSFSTVVPDGVNYLTVLCVEEGGNVDSGGAGTYLTINGVVVCRAGPSPIGTGGDGGRGGSGDVFGDEANAGGGGGAGGYSGNGGRGGDTNEQGLAGATSSGAGGGGSSGYYPSVGDGGSAAGGGVGLLGIGSTGAASGVTGGGKGGSGGGDGTGTSTPGSYGGGRGNSAGPPLHPGEFGGRLRYVNNIPVIPGQSLVGTITAARAANGAIRYLWGGGRSYPSNAGNM